MSRSTTLLNLILPVITMSITFAFYTLVQKQELTASKGTSQLQKSGAGLTSSLYEYDCV